MEEYPRVSDEKVATRLSRQPEELDPISRHELYVYKPVFEDLRDARIIISEKDVVLNAIKEKLLTVVQNDSIYGDAEGLSKAITSLLTQVWGLSILPPTLHEQKDARIAELESTIDRIMKINWMPQHSFVREMIEEKIAGE